MTAYAHELTSGHRALLQSQGRTARAQALNLSRAPIDAADADMAEKRRAAAGKERVLIRARTVYVTRGPFRVPETRYDVLRVAGLATELVAAGCVFWEQAVAIASDAIKGRVTVAMGGHRTLFSGGGGVLTASTDIALVKGLAGDAGTGWKKPRPGEFVEIKGGK